MCHTLVTCLARTDHSCILVAYSVDFIRENEVVALVQNMALHPG